MESEKENLANPWKVSNIQEFNFFCCPECVYRSKEEVTFQAHALLNHVLSKTFFNENSCEIEVKSEKNEIEQAFESETSQEIRHAQEIISKDVELNKNCVQEIDAAKEIDEFFDSKQYCCSKCPQLFQGLLNLAEHLNKGHELENDR